MKNYIYSGNSIPIIAETALKSGQCLYVKNMFGVVANSVDPGHSTELMTVGVYDLEKDNNQIENCKEVYWDLSTSKVTVEAGEKRIKIGVAAEPAGAMQAHVRVRLNGVSI